MKQSAGGVHKGPASKKHNTRRPTVRTHLSAEDIAAMANMQAYGDQSYTRISGHGVVSKASIVMSNNNSR